MSAHQSRLRVDVHPYVNSSVTQTQVGSGVCWSHTFAPYAKRRKGRSFLINIKLPLMQTTLIALSEVFGTATSRKSSNT